MCEEELPTKLDKLEIGPILPQIKLIHNKLPVSLNPFFNEATEDPASVANDTNVIFGDVKCSCRVRRRSESVLDDCKSTVTVSSTLAPIEHSIKNQTQFKHKNRKKVILREPILKSLQKCLHPKHVKAFSGIQNRIANNGEDLNTTCPTIEALNLDDSITTLRINSEEPSVSSRKKYSSGITDFRDLIAECHSLLETNFSWNTSIASRRHLKNFNVIQSTENRSQKLRHNACRHNAGYCADDSHREECGLKQPGATTSSNTSCSQQARINASTISARAPSTSIASTPSCDVTIDELASYFETIVHIPRKMSSMAEMMYI